jgi:hypothetical protein
MEAAMVRQFMGALALLALPAAAPAAVSYVGVQEGLQGWRSTSVAKTVDADGDNVYGTAGYALFGPTRQAARPGITTRSTPIRFSSRMPSMPPASPGRSPRSRAT